MAEKQKIQGKIEVAGIVGPFWFMAWLFSIGFIPLSGWKIVWALLVWPYYLGLALQG